MALTASVTIPDEKLHYLEDLKNLALKHGIVYVKSVPTNTGTIFNFKLKDGEEDKKKDFLDEVKAEWL